MDHWCNGKRMRENKKREKKGKKKKERKNKTKEGRVPHKFAQAPGG